VAGLILTVTPMPCARPENVSAVLHDVPLVA